MLRTLFALSVGLLAAVLLGCGDDASSGSPGQTGAPAAYAAAVQPWQDLHAYPVPRTELSTHAKLSYDAAGNALASWPVAGAQEGRAERRDVALLPISADGVAGKPSQHDGFVLAGPFGAPAGSGELLDAGNNDDATHFSGLAVRAATSDGEIDDVETLIPADRLAISVANGAATLAVAEGGASVVAWVEFDRQAGRNGEERLRAAVRAGAGEGYGRPVTLRQGRGGLTNTDGLAAAVDERGRVAVAFAATEPGRGAAVRLWTGDATSGFAAAPITLGRAGAANEVRTSITTTGRTIVAWGAEVQGERSSSSWIVRAASVAAGKSSPSRVETIGEFIGVSREVGVPSTNLALAPGPRGTALMAWTENADTPDARNRVAEAPASGRFGNGRDVPGAAIGGLAIRRDGAAVATVADRDDGGPSRWYALSRPPGADSFGVAEPLAGGEIGSTAPQPFYSPKTGRVSIAWIVADTTGAGEPSPRLLIQTRAPQ